MTNVNEDGSIPAGSKPNWSTPGLNNFRQNKQPDSEFGAPDAIVAIEPLCMDPDKYSLVATVRNVGEAALPAGVVVGFYTGDPPVGADGCPKWYDEYLRGGRRFGGAAPELAGVPHRQQCGYQLGQVRGA